LGAGALPDCRRQAGKVKTLSDWRSPVRLTSAMQAGRRDKCASRIRQLAEKAWLIYFIDRVMFRPLLRAKMKPNFYW